MAGCPGCCALQVEYIRTVNAQLRLEAEHHLERNKADELNRRILNIWASRVELRKLISEHEIAHKARS
jgi:hypothetical protein